MSLKGMNFGFFRDVFITIYFYFNDLTDRDVFRVIWRHEDDWSGSCVRFEVSRIFYFYIFNRIKIGARVSASEEKSSK